MHHLCWSVAWLWLGTVPSAIPNVGMWLCFVAGEREGGEALSLLCYPLSRLFLDKGEAEEGCRGQRQGGTEAGDAPLHCVSVLWEHHVHNHHFFKKD